MYYFRSQKNIITSYVDFNVLTKSRSKVFSVYLPFGFFDSKVSCQYIVMMMTNYFRTNNLRDI